MKVKACTTVHSSGGESSHPHLSPGKIYYVIGFDDECYRVVNDAFEPVLYPKGIFEVIDSNYPLNWVRADYEDGEYYVDPPEFSEPGFYEDFFEGCASAREKYNRYLKLNGICK